MSNTRPSSFKWSIVSVALAAVAALSISARAQEAATPAAPNTGYVDDWTHHHVVFSNPGTREDAERNGTLERWTRITNDPRYRMQQVKRNLGTRAVVADPDLGFGPGGFRNDRGPRRIRQKNLPVQGGLEKDWNTPLGGAPASSGSGLTGTVNTLSSSNIGPNSTLSIQIKFGGRTVNFRILQASAPTPQTEAITFSNQNAPANGSSVTIGGITYTFSTSNITTAPASGCTVYSATGYGGVTNLRDAIDNTTPGATTFMCAAAASPNPLVTATSRFRRSSTINVSALTPGPVTTFTFSQSGTTNLTATATAGTDGGSYCTYPTGPYYSGGGGFFNTPRFCYWDENGDNKLDSSAQVAANIAAAINASWLGQFIKATAVGSTITYTFVAGQGVNNIAVVGNNFTAYSSGVVGGTLATVQPNALPAMYSSSPITANCATDFVVYPTGQPGSSTAASIIAYNQLYGVTADAGATPPVTGTGCGATSGVNVPTAYWAYNTGSGQMVSTSPVLSLDGKQVAFVESTGTAANLVLLKWNPTADGANIQAPDTATAATLSTYRGCTAPCMVTMSLSVDSSYSAPYYDATSDAIYVGDNTGRLHKFTGVFLGTPAESGSPFAMTGGNPLSSPVYDATSGITFVGDMAGTLWYVGSGGGSANSYLGPLTDAITDGPLVDSSAGMVYAFLGDCTLACNTSEPGFDAVLQSSISGTTVNPVVAITLGTGGKGYYIYDGAFDNAYFTSATPASPSGNLYVMGNTGPTGDGGTLYKLTINGNVLCPECINNTPPDTDSASGLSSGGVSPWPSPVTEYYNTSSGTDYIYFSVNSGAASSACTAGAGNGCILEFDVTGGVVNGTINGQNFTTVGGKGCWTTGGISIDGSTSGQTGTQNIYFVSLNGAVAGSNAVGGSIRPTSTSCGTNSPAILGAIQASQNNP